MEGKTQPKVNRHELYPYQFNQEQFEQYIRPRLSVAKRGYECSIPLYKVFNYILYRLHTGCQWERLPIDNDPGEPTKKKSAINADAAFDTKAARWTCFNHKLIPNIVENTRSRKRLKRGRKGLFNRDVYKLRFTSERTFAWIDKFRALLVRFDRKAAHFLGAHYIVYALINLRHLLATEKSQ